MNRNVNELLAQGIVPVEILNKDMFNINPGITQAAIRDIVFSVIELMVDRMIEMEFFDIKFIGFFYRKSNKSKNIKFDFIAHKSLKYIFNLRTINQQHYKLPRRSILVEEFLRSSSCSE